MVRAAAVILLTLLTGCDVIQRADRQEHQAAMLEIKVDTLRIRIDQLEKENKRVKELARAANNLAISTSDASESLRKTFNNNVEIGNENARRERTSQGVCGQETVWQKDGGYVIRNKDCPLRK